MENTNLDQTLLDLNKIIKDLAQAAHQPVAQEITKYLEFRAKKGDTNIGKGIIWSGDGTTKQIIFNANPDRFIVTENVDISKDKAVYIGGVKTLDGSSLGSNIVKSNLREVGRLKGLIVDGNLNINQSLFYNSSLDRIGLGTYEPNASIGILKDNVELSLGVSSEFHGILGTYTNSNVDIISGNIPRLSIKNNGNIDLGNPTKNPILVKVHGKISVGVENPDPNVDLHVQGPVRINNKLHLSANTPPISGSFNLGDIVWNSEPRVQGCIGWVCLRAGSPGMWYPFGEIKEQNK